MTDNFNPKNSIWPNGSKMDEDGYVTFYPLGTNKIDVPTTGWPKGTKLVAPFVYDKDNHVVGFVDTKAMTTTNGNANIYLPYELIQADFSSIEKGTLGVYAPNAVVKNALWSDGTVSDLPEAQYKYKGCTTVDDVKAVDPNYKTTDIVDGVWSEPLWDLEDGNPTDEWNGGMFRYCENLTSFSSDLPSLTNGKNMFNNCTNLTSFSSDLSSLTNGGWMFSLCSNLTSFSSDLSSLTNGTGMFNNCFNLTTFSSDLSNLMDGYAMFYGSALASFSSDLSSLTDGSEMFKHCDNLTTFSSDLSSLTNGRFMFDDCTNLTSFSSDLSSLTDGYDMFYVCKLDTASVQNIADTINTYSGTIYIGIGNSEPNEQEKAAFNKMVSKGWTVYVNGSKYIQKPSTGSNPTDIELDEVETPIPFWAKPVPSDEQNAQYVDSEGNYYNILGAQFIYGDDLSTYGMFTCFDDAQAQMRLTKFTKGEEPVIIETA